MEAEPQSQKQIDARIVLARPRVAIAEDDDDVRCGLAGLFAQDGFEVSCVADGELLVDHLEWCRQNERLPDILILDHRMPGYCGLEVLDGLKSLNWRTPVIMISAFGAEILEAARTLGACAVFEKPFDPDDLRTAVAYWIGSKRQHIQGRVHGHGEANSGPAVCAACGTSVHIRLEERLPDTYFCAECWERAIPPEEDDEIGVSD
ncbi:MAG: response regulator [Myxococcota bacterium]